MLAPIAVSVLGKYLKQIIDSEEMLRGIKIFGEVSDYLIKNGNAFFSLKDSDATISCILFDAEKFFVPKIGDKIIVEGTPRYFVKNGKLSFNAEKIEVFGEGDLFKKFLELKNKLEKEGLFDITKKLSLPKSIKKIGVISSETGAVIHDIINVVQRRNEQIDIVLFPVKVQGIGAEIQIVKALNYFNNSDVDAVIIARGGGSQDDLQTFNTEAVVRAVFSCDKFVVSAIGHETDITLCDYVADIRVPTPSVAGEILSASSIESALQLNRLKDSMTSLITNKLNGAISKLENLQDKNINFLDKMLLKQDNIIDVLSNKLSLINPLSILKLGYAKIEREGSRISSVKNLKINDKIDVNFIDGVAKSLVDKIEERKWIIKKTWTNCKKL